MSKKTPKKDIYSKIILEIFKSHYKKGMEEFEFSREEFSNTAKKLKVSLPKNLGDVLYSFRFTKELPTEIIKTATGDKSWAIFLSGKGKYKFALVKNDRILPRENLEAIMVPDSTPEIIKTFSLNDEQSLLAQLRYNRLIDIFLGLTTYSLQNHLRTTVKGVGQIEIDEIYVGLDKKGARYIIPVQAKGGSDQLGIVQSQQDILCCKEKFGRLICRAVSTQFMENGVIAMFELGERGGDIKIIDEKHYQLVPADKLEN